MVRFWWFLLRKKRIPHSYRAVILKQKGLAAYYSLDAKEEKKEKEWNMPILVSNGEVHAFPVHHPVEPLKEHVPFLFHDCLGREISVGDVLACGQRRGSHGGIRIGIVRGFTERTILVDILDDGYPTYNRGEDHTMPYREWTWRKGHFNTGYNCCITGMIEMQLREMTDTQEGVFGE